MPVPSTSLYGGQGKPSCYDRVSTSFMMGATIGITIGILFGGLGGLRYFIYIFTLKFYFQITIIIRYRSGFRGRELISSMGKTMLQSGGTFGTFMGVGAALRC